MRYRLLRPLLRTLAWLLLGLATLVPTLAAAQVYELRVSLHDAGGQALTAITVILRDEQGRELRRGLTDTQGMVSFGELPPLVRVAVEGQPRGGPPLFQLGDDARGVRVDLSQAEQPGVLNLRVERDGLVLPDPATMLSLEQNGPLVESTTPLPTALIATPASPLPGPATGSSGTIIVGVAPATVEDRGTAWAPLVTVLVIAGAVGVMLFLQRRRDAR